MTNPIVSVAWLMDHLNDSEIVILDARLDQNQSNLENNNPDLQIKGARLFDIKNMKLSTTNWLRSTITQKASLSPIKGHKLVLR